MHSKVSGSNLPQGESYQSLEDKGINEIEIVSIDLREDRAIFIILFFFLYAILKKIIYVEYVE